MIVLDPQADVQHQVSAWVTLLSRVVWPALATLVPAGVTALFKIAQNHSRSRRATQLADRISQLSKSLAELPDVPTTSPSGATPRSTLNAELNLAVTELCSLQSKVRHNLRGATTSFTARLRSALLLYRPIGRGALMVHTLFYLYTAFFLFCIFSVLAYGGDQPGGSGFFTTTSIAGFLGSMLAFIFLVGLFSIPMLVLHHMAVKIHRKQLQAELAAAPQPTETHAAPPMPLSQEHMGS